MKTVLVWATLVLFSAILVKADPLNGVIVAGPATVKVRAQDGSVKEYKISPEASKMLRLRMDEAESEHRSFLIKWGHTTTSIFATLCPNYIGQLVEPLNLVVQAADGSTKNVKVSEATASPDSSNYVAGNVRIYGTCNESANVLDGLSIVTTLSNGHVQ